MMQKQKIRVGFLHADRITLIELLVKKSHLCCNRADVTKKSAHGQVKLFSFTLIELLVVIAMMAILAAMLLPALGKTKGIARRSQCVHQQKQIGMGMISYYNDYKSFPYVTNPHEVPEPKSWGYYVRNHIKFKNNILFKCPEHISLFPVVRESEGISSYAVQTHFMPAYNYSKKFYAVGQHFDKLKKPGKSMFLADGGVWRRRTELLYSGVVGDKSGHQLHGSWQNPNSFNLANENNRCNLMPRHPNMVINMLFADLHAESKKLPPVGNIPVEIIFRVKSSITGAWIAYE